MPLSHFLNGCPMQHQHLFLKRERVIIFLIFYVLAEFLLFCKILLFVICLKIAVVFFSQFHQRRTQNSRILLRRDADSVKTDTESRETEVKQKASKNKDSPDVESAETTLPSIFMETSNDQYSVKMQVNFCFMHVFYISRVIQCSLKLLPDECDRKIIS